MSNDPWKVLRDRGIEVKPNTWLPTPKPKVEFPMIVCISCGAKETPKKAWMWLWLNFKTVDPIDICPRCVPLIGNRAIDQQEAGL